MKKNMEKYKKNEICGTVVELTNLERRTDWNGRRGIVVHVFSEKPRLKYIVLLEDTKIIVKPSNLKKVYCIGVPKEYWSTSDILDHEKVLLSTLSQVNSSHFYVFVKSNSKGSSVFLFNNKFFEMSFERMDTEPLLRIYGMEKSQQETNIVFGCSCVKDSSETVYPGYIDIGSEYLMNLMSRFSENTSQEELKKLNFADFT